MVVVLGNQLQQIIGPGQKLEPIPYVLDYTGAMETRYAIEFLLIAEL